MGAMRLAIRTATTAATKTDSVESAVARVKAGDVDAFRIIFDRYARPISSFIFDMVNDRELADELAQETFVRAFRSLESLRDEARLSTWLFGIAKFVAYENIRARTRRKHVGFDDLPEQHGSDDVPGPDNQLLGKELNGRIQDALGALDEDRRAVFVLKVFQQKSYEEISSITGFTIAKLKTDLHRARADMRKRLSPYLKGGL